MRKTKFLQICLIFCVCLNVFAQTKDVKSLVSAETFDELQKNGFVKKIHAGQDSDYKLLPLCEYKEICLQNKIAKSEENFPFIYESLFLIPKAEILEKSNSAKQTFNIEDVSTVFRSFSKMQGMKYFSTTRKKEKILYENAYTIANETSSEKISDKNTGNADGQVLFCYQEDASFGVCRYKVEYKQNQDTLFALFSNIDTLGIGPFKAIFPGKMKINTIVIDCGDSILLYLGTDADSKKLPGIKGQLEDSFSSRMDAIYKWFLTQF